jgi:hypothetical protein
MDPLSNDVKPTEELVMPSISDGTPLPGQEASPQEDEKAPADDRVVPLAALHEERTRRQELQAELEVLRQIAGDRVLFDVHGNPVPNAMPQQQQREPSGPAKDTAKEIEQLWETDPRKAVQVEIMAAMSWRDNMESQVDNQMLAASTKYSDFTQHESTVRQYIRALPLDQRSKPGIVDLAYYVVKGQNSDSAIEKARGEVLRKIQAGEQVQGLQPGTRPAAPTPKGIQLSEDQLKVAAAMGLTPDQYKSAMVQK